MARLYNDQTKAAIVSAVKDARSAGKKGSEVLEAAKGAGYKGSEQALRKMIYTDKAFAGVSKGRRGRRPKSATPPTGRRPGRPPGSKNKTKSGSMSGGLGDIERIISEAVRERINAALGDAIKALQSARI